MAKLKCICKRCGKEFFVFPSDFKASKGRYCSRECRIVGKIKRICIYCGKEFYRYPSDIKISAGKYCSRKCYFESKSPIKCVCKICGKEFYETPSRIKENRGQFCSNKCKYTPRRIIIKNDYALVPLTKGEFAKIDIEDIEKINEHDWHTNIQKNGRLYACSKSFDNENLIMHRIIMNAKENELVDHIENSKTLDNRKKNLRICNKAQNAWNSRKQKRKTSSKYKGVSFNKIMKKFESYITCNKNRIRLGYFDDEIEAAKTYDAKAIELFGEFANTNF